MLQIKHIILPAAPRCYIASAITACAILALIMSPRPLSEGREIMILPPLQTLKVLSDADRKYYRAAFEALNAKHYAEAMEILTHVNDSVLKGAVLAEQYLNSDSKARYAELADWLTHYKDHPQASAIYHMALNRKSVEVDFPEAPVSTKILKGFSNGNDRSTLHNAAHWNAGLAAYRRHDMQTAAEHFRAILASGSELNSVDRAASAFWAYRALQAAGDSATAMQYAAQAANEPPSFYSILARHVTGEHSARAMDHDSRVAMVTPLLSKDAVRRAIALKEIGQDAMAEQELRTLFPASEDADRKRLVTLAMLLDLPGAQMRMALAYARGEEDQASDAFYPMPRWTPTSGYRIEPALLFAIMRQESGFNPDAKSASGAIGVMQLMPATAHAMARMEGVAIHGNQPAVSMSLGQSYIEHLMDTPAIGDNLVYLTAAYNAGPGTVAVWEHNLHCANDPLLFVESIPFSETREYVMRVMGNYWVYSEMLSGMDSPSATALSQGVWPHYESSGKQLSSMLVKLGAAQAE